jgi:hypothetical protein
MNMEVLSNSIKRPNLRIIGIEEGEEVQAKGICNIFNKIITENFPNLKTDLPIQVQETSRTANSSLAQRELPHGILLKQAQRTEKEYQRL